MHTVMSFVRKHGTSIVLSLMTLVLVTLFVMPYQAQAMEIERWTAKPSEEGKSDVVGGMPTRITWQGQAASDESIKSLLINFPSGTSIDQDNVKVTVLDGLERLLVSSKVSVQDSAVTITFGSATPAGSLIMLEFNRTLLPVEGGTFGSTGSYTTDNNQSHSLPETDKTIDVVSSNPAQQISSWLSEQSWVKAWNSNKFFHLFLDPTVIVTSIPTVFAGWILALVLVVISFPLAVPFGLIWSFLRMAKHRLPRALGSTYINIVRGTPLFLQIYIAFFGLPLMGIKMDNIVLGIIVLVMNSSAYLAEIFRAGIQSINKGQSEAARSLGMNSAQTMFFVIIPQTVRRVIPTMTSEFILMYKDTSLLAAVGVMEIMMYAKTITAATGNVTPYIVAAGFYLIVTIPMTKFINSIEVRLSRTRRKHSKNDDIDKPGSLEESEATKVAHDLRFSETFAAPPQKGFGQNIMADALRGGNHLSH